MSDTRIISQSYINQISDAIDILADNADSVRDVVSNVRNKAGYIERGLDFVKREFESFLEFDEQQKELSKAKIQIVNVRQRVQEEFGVNDSVRQYLTGILEASDLSMVKQRIITDCTERLMISCPEYWLAPCLVAVAAWLNNDIDLADRALRESLKRDEEKTSLLFSLICRRIGRMNASAVWLERYLMIQDPHNMERKMISVLDAYSNGLFGPQSKAICAEQIQKWITELSEEPGFVENQQADWEESMNAMVDDISFNSKYPYSAKYCTNWRDCSNSINETGLHVKLLGYFKGIFEKPSTTNTSLIAQLDDLLENYISSYDNAELPLRREERLLELIIEERGRIDRAEMRYNAEQKALDEIFDFTQLLTSAAMHADIIKASNATQRLAIALSKSWIIPAYENVILRIRQNIPNKFNIEIEGWKESIEHGTEEKQLCLSAENYLNNKRNTEVNSIQQSKLDIVVPAACALVSIFGFLSSSSMWGILGLLATAGFLLRWYTNKENCEKTRAEIRAHYDELIKNVKSAIYALCAERVDYIKEIEMQDSYSEQTLTYLKEIEVGQYVNSGNSRNIAL